MPSKQKIRTFLRFDGNAEEAMNFYVSVFHDSKVLDVFRSKTAGAGVAIHSYQRAGTMQYGSVEVTEWRETLQRRS